MANWASKYQTVNPVLHSRNSFKFTEDGRKGEFLADSVLSNLSTRVGGEPSQTEVGSTKRGRGPMSSVLKNK